MSIILPVSKSANKAFSQNSAVASLNDQREAETSNNGPLTSGQIKIEDHTFPATEIKNNDESNKPQSLKLQ
jgi:hypothetical protein